MTPPPQAQADTPLQTHSQRVAENLQAEVEENRQSSIYPADRQMMDRMMKNIYPRHRSRRQLIGMDSPAADALTRFRDNVVHPLEIEKAWVRYKGKLVLYTAGKAREAFAQDTPQYDLWSARLRRELKYGFYHPEGITLFPSLDYTVGDLCVMMNVWEFVPLATLRRRLHHLHNYIDPRAKDPAVDEECLEHWGKEDMLYCEECMFTLQKN
jgi:hypothetical protein